MQIHQEAKVQAPKPKVFEFNDYRAYLFSRLGPAGSRNGGRRRLAIDLGVHGSLLSLVMGGKLELSLEAAEGVNRHFMHDVIESEYFLFLVQRSRAGTPELRARWDSILQRLRAEQQPANSA